MARDGSRLERHEVLRKLDFCEGLAFTRIRAKRRAFIRAMHRFCQPRICRGARRKPSAFPQEHR